MVSIYCKDESQDEVSGTGRERGKVQHNTAHVHRPPPAVIVDQEPHGDNMYVYVTTFIHMSWIFNATFHKQYKHKVLEFLYAMYTSQPNLNIISIK